MPAPEFVTLNNHRIRVQRWHREPHAISFTTVIRGENLGNELAHAVTSDQAELMLDDDETLSGTARILEHRVTGTGTTATHRMDILFHPDTHRQRDAPQTTDEKLDAILEELQELRREIESLKSQHIPRRSTDSLMPPAASTLLDFEIPMNDDERG